MKELTEGGPKLSCPERAITCRGIRSRRQGSGSGFAGRQTGVYRADKGAQTLGRPAVPDFTEILEVCRWA
ncbi:hypothetical protein B1R94_07610 [Mycolicibacterium litorale]|nr:hypothetical protein B1R94_07610 [Mycolicibacterium litorale]